MRQSRTPIIAFFASLSFAAVMTGLLAGRACDARKPSAPTADVPPLLHAVDPHAPLTPANVVDAPVGARDAIPLVAIAAPAARPARNERTARPPRGDPHDVVPPARDIEPPALPAAPAAAAASPPATSVVVDAGVANADATRRDRAPDALPSAPLVVTYRDELTWLKLVEMRVFLNGKRVVDDKPTDANRPARGERKLFETRVFPGHHQVRVETVYTGEDSGIFNYMSSVRVRMREMIVVEVDASNGAQVTAHAFDRGALEPWEKRPSLKLTQR